MSSRPSAQEEAWMAEDAVLDGKRRDARPRIVAAASQLRSPVHSFWLERLRTCAVIPGVLSMLCSDALESSYRSPLR
jgi:hypothetical protein